MATLPQLLEEDIAKIEASLRELIKKSDASTALVADKGGFLIASRGNHEDFDLTSIAALASGAFMASQSIAGMVNDSGFENTFQQGANYGIYIQNIDENCVLLVLFPADVGVGTVKYFAGAASHAIAHQLLVAQERDPSAGLDLSVLNVSDPSEFFKRRD